MLVAVTAMVMTGCGVAAPDKVASIDGVDVTLEDLIRTASDPLYSLVSPDWDGPTISGDAARQALTVNLTTAAWVAEAGRWGLDTNSKRAEAEASLDQQLSVMAEPLDLSDDAREGFIEMFAAQFALQERFEKIDPTSDDDLRQIYDLSSMLWEQTCAFILTVPDDAQGEVRSLAARGVDATEVAERVDGTSVITTPDDGCMSEGSIPSQIRDDLRTVPVGESDLFDIDSGGMTQHFMVQVVSRGTVRFGDAREDLVAIAAALLQSGPQEWVGLRLVEAGIDPRIGSGVTLDGQSQPHVVPPAGPIQPKFSMADVGLDMIDG